MRNPPAYPIYINFNSSVCGGFPVVVRAGLCPPEPDVGFSGWYVDDMELYTEKGYPADFITLTEEEDSRLVSEAIAYYTQGSEE